MTDVQTPEIVVNEDLLKRAFGPAEDLQSQAEYEEERFLHALQDAIKKRAALLSAKQLAERSRGSMDGSIIKLAAKKLVLNELARYREEIND